METRIRTKNMELTGHLEDYIREKLRKVEKFISEAVEEEAVEMEIEVEKITQGQNKGDVYRIEAQIFCPGVSIRAEDASTTPKEAVSEVRYELERQIKEYKSKQATLKRKGAREAKKIREEKNL